MQHHIDTVEALEREVRHFLDLEAECLDEGRLKDWMSQYVDEGIRYVIPIRQTRMKQDGAGFDAVASLQDDDWPALRMRANRLDSKAAWSENPPTRLRHFISNLRVEEGLRPSDLKDGSEVKIKSNVLVYRTRGESPEHDLLSAERHDVLRFTEGRFKLLRREVRLDMTTIGTHNFAFIF